MFIVIPSWVTSIGGSLLVISKTKSNKAIKGYESQINRVKKFNFIKMFIFYSLCLIGGLNCAYFIAGIVEEILFGCKFVSTKPQLKITFFSATPIF